MQDLSAEGAAKSFGVRSLMTGKIVLTGQGPQIGGKIIY